MVGTGTVMVLSLIYTNLFLIPEISLLFIYGSGMVVSWRLREANPQMSGAKKRPMLLSGLEAPPTLPRV